MILQLGPVGCHELPNLLHAWTLNHQEPYILYHVAQILRVMKLLYKPTHLSTADAPALYVCTAIVIDTQVIRAV